MESHAFIDLYGPRIVCAHMQEGCFLRCKYLRQQNTHERARVAVAYMVWMRADRADLGESRHAHAESRHRGQLAVAAYAYVSAEIVSTFAEGTRLGEFRECHHLRRIGIGQFDEFMFRLRYGCR